MEVNNFTRFKVDKKFIKTLAERVLRGEHRRIDLSVSLIGRAEMRRINKKYRKVDRPTDVLSFTYNDFGEILISPQVVKENAKKYGENSKEEMARALIHGILHILGYDHEGRNERAEKMKMKEGGYLKH